jgi:hypothetical protein
VCVTFGEETHSITTVEDWLKILDIIVQAIAPSDQVMSETMTDFAMGEADFATMEEEQ